MLRCFHARSVSHDGGAHKNEAASSASPRPIVRPAELSANGLARRVRQKAAAADATGLWTSTHTLHPLISYRQQHPTWPTDRPAVCLLCPAATPPAGAMTTCSLIPTPSNALAFSCPAPPARRSNNATLASAPPCSYPGSSSVSCTLSCDRAGTLNRLRYCC